MDKAYFVQLARYNSWANNKAISWVEQLDDVQWEQLVTGSFNSVQQTVMHIASAENVWIDFWRKHPDPVFLSSTFSGTREELITIWQQASAGMLAIIEAWPEEKFLQPVVFKYPRGGDGQLLFSQTVAHVMNHSTYHRGQLVSALRQVGYTNFSSIDMATYFIFIR